MKSTLNNVLIFTVGAAIGSAVTWYFVKTKYERIAQEEIDSVKEEFTKNDYVGPQDADEAESIEEDDILEDDPVTKEKHDILVKSLGYHNYSDVESNTTEEVSSVGNPRVITPDEFGENGYKIVELTYWADNVLTDNKNKRVKDVDALIGKGTLDRFGEYEEDCLHVRDDEKKIDFEILRDLKRYSDFFDDEPHQAEEE